MSKGVVKVTKTASSHCRSNDSGGGGTLWQSMEQYVDALVGLSTHQLLMLFG